MKTYTVVGIYESNFQRFACSYVAHNPEDAEQQAEAEQAPGDRLIVAGVFEGDLSPVA